MNQTKICSKCNIEKEVTEFNKAKLGKYGVRAECKVCFAERKRQWQQKNKEHIIEYGKQYREDNKESIAEKNKQYFQVNKDHMAAYLQANKDERAAKAKQYRQTPEGKAAHNASNQNRRAQKLNNGGKHTGKQILALFDLQSGACPYCNTKLYKSGNNKFHIDHVMPLSKGGSNGIENLQLLCPPCNLSKNDKLPEDFAAKFNKLF